jgi:hypothetical protein
MAIRLTVEMEQKEDQVVPARQVVQVEQPQVAMLPAAKDLTVQHQAIPV